MPAPRPPRPSAPPAQLGFSMVEVMVTLGVVVVAVLGHVSTTLSEHRLLKEQRARSVQLQAAQQFAERLRSDDAWATLYARLRAKAVAAQTPGPGAVRLDDGREAFAPSTYYTDFVPPTGAEDARVLVDVPAMALTTPVPAPPALRETATAPRFGLPADLNGDGKVDANSRDADYAVLPVEILWTWAPPGEARRQIRIQTWLRGDR